jgi:3-methyladenine DNA glycosylase AlkD
VAQAFRDLPLGEVRSLVRSSIHEERLLGLLILVGRFQKAEIKERERIYRFYVTHMRWINNWDLVDLTAPYVTGPYLENRSKKPLFLWAKSKHLWTRRISILSTFHYIRKKQFSEALRISKVLLLDEHDLIHKAVGWMLREIGKRDLKTEEHFLKAHYRKMPRTMLRYAIERFPEKKRQAYLKGTVR